MAENGDKPQKVDDLAAKLGVDPVLLGKRQQPCIGESIADSSCSPPDASPGRHGLRQGDWRERVPANQLYQVNEHPHHWRRLPSYVSW